MSAITISKWINRTPDDQNKEELAIVLNAIIDYLNALDARLTAHGI